MATTFKGNDKALFGIVLAVITFWLFAQTTLNIGPVIAEDINTPLSVMNIAISLSALFSGMFIVVAGGFADRLGRVKVAILGNLLNIVGSLLVGLAFGGGLATVMLITGRILQGLSAACIMPSTMALLKTYWEGAERQRAVSMWSIGSWGGSGLAALFGGFMASTMFGWRSVFILGALISVVSIILLRAIPEDAPAAASQAKTDVAGIVTLALTVLSLLIVVTQGSAIGWTSAITWVLVGVFVISLTEFIRTEQKTAAPLVDFSLFSNPVFTGATVSNLLINATAGLIPVSLWVLQGAGGMSAAKSGYLTIGYAVFIIGFIRVGEKLLRTFGSKKPMIWGALIVIVAIALLMFTNVMQGTYVILAIIAYCLFGLGLAFYATPSTDAALSALPDDKAGSGSGVYKMASSLGAAFGAAIPTSIFTALQTSGSEFLGAAVVFTGQQDNVAVRQAAMIAMGSILFMALIALSSIILLIPASSGKKIVEAQADEHPGAARIAEIKEQLEALQSRAQTLEDQIADTKHRLEEAKREYSS